MHIESEKKSALKQAANTLVVSREDAEAINLSFADAPYKSVALSEIQNRFLDELMQIIEHEALTQKAKEEALKRKAQEIFDHFKKGNSISASLAARQALITIVEVIKYEKKPQDWDWIDMALLGVGDQNWYYLP
ncbi:MAG: hypothetical protein ACX93T_02575 [Bacteroidota bacterium]